MTVRIYSGTSVAGTQLQSLPATRNSSGAYSVDASPALAPGTYTARAEQSDTASNTGYSPATTFTISGSSYFATLASGTTGLPSSDAGCAALVGSSSFEPRLDNYLANTSIPSGPVPWSTNSTQTYWTKWIAKRNQVTGNYTGSTDQIFSWAACKWGIDENLMRAVAVQESSWHQNTQGDFANGAYHSFGIMQVRDTANSGGVDDWGGYPDTLNETALNGDFYGAATRACLDGDFYDGGSWLYGGQTIQQVIAARGFDYALWGCVGSWFSGGWYDSSGQNYINQVKQWLAASTWQGYSTTGSANDIRPPSVPTGLSAGAGATQVTLSWNSSSDNAGVAGYRVYRNGTLIASPTSSPYTVTGLTTGTTYSFSVAARDTTGNSSARSPNVSVTTG